MTGCPGTPQARRTRCGHGGPELRQIRHELDTLSQLRRGWTTGDAERDLKRCALERNLLEVA